MKTLIKSLLAVVVLSMVLISCGGSRGTITITEEDLAAEMDRAIAQYTSQGMEVTEEQRASIRTAVLDQLVQRALLREASVAAGHSVSDEDIQAEIDTVQAQFGDYDSFMEVMNSYGYTEESLRAEITDALLIQTYLEEDVLPSVSVSDADVEAFYNENPDYFSTSETVTASHILVQLEEGADQAARNEAYAKMENIQDILASGADFAETAIEYSEGPSAPSGGDLGAFERGMMVAPFEEAAFAMEVGEISEIVETQFGLHLIYVRDKSDAGMMPLEEVTPSIRDYLASQKEQETIEAQIEELRNSYTLDVPEA